MRNVGNILYDQHSVVNVRNTPQCKYLYKGEMVCARKSKDF